MVLTRFIELNDDEFVLVCDHGHRQMRDRHVTEAEVIETYNHYDSSYPQKGKNQRINYRKKFDNYTIKIAIQITVSGPNILVTAIKKYD